MNSPEVGTNRLSGLVEGFNSNKHGDIDAVYIKTSNGVVKLKFPPHMARQVMGKINAGQQVLVTYTEKSKPEKKTKLELTSIKRDEQDDAMVIRHEKPKKADSGNPIETIKSEKFTLICDKKDKIVGIKTDDKLIHLHKEDEEIAMATRPDSALTIQGRLRTDEGFVNEQDLPVYHIKSIDIDGRSFQPSKKK